MNLILFKKVRKLEFIFSEALDKGCDSVITGGALQSNHARATAVVAKELGMDSHCVVIKRVQPHYSFEKKQHDFKMNFIAGYR